MRYTHLLAAGVLALTAFGASAQVAGKQPAADKQQCADQEKSADKR